MNIKEKAFEKCNKLRDDIIASRISCSEISEKQYNYEFEVNLERDKLKVQVYFGKKGIKTVLQGNQNSELFNEINQIVNEQQQLLFIENNDEPTIYIGSDESGKGDIFGPLVTTAFFVDEKTKLELISLGVKDSKELRDGKIEVIANSIKKKFPNNFVTITLYPEKYNELYGKFNNLNVMLTWTHSKAISELLKIHKCKNVIVDKFSNLPLNISLESYDNKIDILQIHKGERYIGVAAASIVARNAFNNWFKQMEKEYFEFPKGASATVDEKLKLFIKKYSTNELNKVSKMHFKTVKKYLF